MPRTRQRGFTLLELLVAFVILALAVGMLLRSFGQGLRNATLTEDYTLATMHAESVLAALGVEEPLSEDETGGEFGDGYWWQASIRRYEDPEAPELQTDTGITPYRVTVRVYWGEESREPHSLALETLRLGVDEVF